MLEQQELFCHNCQNYIQFSLNIEIDGNYELKCPKCNHSHYRIVRKGKITDERYKSSNQNYYNIVATTYSASSTYTLYAGISTATTASAKQFLYGAWSNTTVY